MHSNDSMHLAMYTCTIGQVHLLVVYKSGQVIKPIIVAKIPCKLLYVYQVGHTYYQSFWLFITIYNAASDCPYTFLQPGYFCLLRLLGAWKAKLCTDASML